MTNDNHHVKKGETKNKITKTYQIHVSLSQWTLKKKFELYFPY